MKYPKVSVIEGDITRINADAIVTAINSAGMWFGGIDDAIQRAAGDFYHNQAEAKMPLKN
jgi:O-acetyl-ADP-ribose deacetylase (regulator of RNase III)